MTNDHSDEQIRALVASAVADAPPAPAIEFGRVLSLERTQRSERSDQPDQSIRADRPDRSAGGRLLPWYVAAAVALAGVTGLVVVDRLDSNPTIEVSPGAASPSSVANSEPSGSTVSVASSSVPDSVSSGGPATEASAPAVGASPAPSVGIGDEEIAVPSTGPGVMVSSSAGGNWVVAGGGGVWFGAAPLVTEANDIGVYADGSIYVQRNRFGIDWEGSQIAAIDVRTSQRENVALPTEFSDSVVALHDAAVVDGRTILLVQTSPTSCTEGTECMSTLWALRLDDGEPIEVARRDISGGDWSRLSLANTGVIVGGVSTSTSEPSAQQPVSYAIATESPIDFAVLGLDPDASCSTCPTGFAIDPAGTVVGWIEGDATSRAIVLTERAIGGSRTIKLSGDDGLPGDVDLPGVPNLAIGWSGDGDLDSGGLNLVINDGGVRGQIDPGPAQIVMTGDGFVKGRVLGEDFYDFG